MDGPPVSIFRKSAWMSRLSSMMRIRRLESVASSVMAFAQVKTGRSRANAARTALPRRWSSAEVPAPQALRVSSDDRILYYRRKSRGTLTRKDDPADAAPSPPSRDLCPSGVGRRRLSLAGEHPVVRAFADPVAEGQEHLGRVDDVLWNPVLRSGRDECSTSKPSRLTGLAPPDRCQNGRIDKAAHAGYGEPGRRLAGSATRYERHGFGDNGRRYLSAGRWRRQGCQNSGGRHARIKKPSRKTLAKQKYYSRQFWSQRRGFPFQ